MNPNIKNKRATSPPNTTIRKILSLFSKPKCIAKTPRMKLKVGNKYP
jgi:hypothetical protein